jgi:hypothetical protein
MFSRATSLLLIRKSSISPVSSVLQSGRTVSFQCKRLLPCIIMDMMSPRGNHLYSHYDNTSLRMFSSSSSHDDFAPKRKVVVDGEEDAIKLIQEHVNNNPIMLYMKGNPSMPMCKYCAHKQTKNQKKTIIVVDILECAHFFSIPFHTDKGFTYVLHRCSQLSPFFLLFYCVSMSRWVFGSSGPSAASRRC